MDLFRDADAPIESLQVGAATEEDVLTVVDDFANTGMQIGGCAASEIAAAFDQAHGEAYFGKGTGGAHAGNTAADHGDCPVWNGS
jgi:hypothetical protein